jgi:hypothetical protein
MDDCQLKQESAMQEWARGNERSCCDSVNEYHRRHSGLKTRKKCWVVKMFRPIGGGIGYRPLPHRIVVFRKEDINPEGQCVSNYCEQEGRPSRTRNGLCQLHPRSLSTASTGWHVIDHFRKEQALPNFASALKTPSQTTAQRILFQL